MPSLFSQEVRERGEGRKTETGGRGGCILTPKLSRVLLLNSQESPGAAPAAVLGLQPPSWAGPFGSEGEGRWRWAGKLIIHFKTPLPSHPQRKGSRERKTILSQTEENRKIGQVGIHFSSLKASREKRECKWVTKGERGGGIN